MEQFSPAQIKLETIWRTVLVTDARNSAQAYFSDRADEALVRIERDRNLFAQIAALYGGEEVRDRGDGSMFAFCDPVAAVQAAMAMQIEIARLNEEQPPETLHLVHRMGVQMGEIKLVTSRFVIDDVATVRRKLSGDMVVVAARLEAICHPGEVCFSNDVYKAIRGRIDHEFRCLDSTLKGFDRPMRCWSTRFDPEWQHPLTTEDEQRRRKKREEKRLREVWEREQREKQRRRLAFRIALWAAIGAGIFASLRFVQTDGTLGPRLERAWTALTTTPSAGQAPLEPVAKEAARKDTPRNVPETPVAAAKPAIAARPRRVAVKPASENGQVLSLLRDGLQSGLYADLATNLRAISPAPRGLSEIADDAQKLGQLKSWIVRQLTPVDADTPVRIPLSRPLGRITFLTGATDQEIRGESTDGQDDGVGFGELTPVELYMVVSMAPRKDGTAPPLPPARARYVLNKLLNLAKHDASEGF